MTRNRQRGATTVEFAIVGGVFFVLLFGMIEFGRAFFVWNALTEATRRGARVAVVCPRDHSAIAQVAVFSRPGGGSDSPVVGGLSTANVTVRYLAADGSTGGDADFVSVAIEGYQHRLLIPFFGRTIATPRFETVLPRESLGLPGGCFGSMS